MKKLVVFTGAGVSAESGLQTFRDSGGLWEEYDVMEVATPEAWQKNPALVLEFYNKRRKQVIDAVPNEAHRAIVRMESAFDVQVITQNIDDLHERAGSGKVLHLHGEIRKSQSSADPNLIYPVEGVELNMGQKCGKGTQLRPHVVWFGEPVPMMEAACALVAKTEILIVIGTSLNVYPAAGLIHFSKPHAEKYIIDPKFVRISDVENLHFIRDNASTGMKNLAEKLLGSNA